MSRKYTILMTLMGLESQGQDAFRKTGGIFWGERDSLGENREPEAEVGQCFQRISDR